MAKNRVRIDGRYISKAATSPAVPVSGDPVVVGQIPGVSIIDEATDGETTVDTAGVYNLSVKGENNAGGSAVAVGDILFFEAGQVPPINKDNVVGIRFGYALGTVGSTLTATIPVKVGY